MSKELNARIQSLIDKGRFSQAKEIALVCVSERGNDPDLLFSLAKIYSHEGDNKMIAAIGDKLASVLAKTTKQNERENIYRMIHKSYSMAGLHEKALGVATNLNGEASGSGLGMMHTSLTKLEKHYEALLVAGKLADLPDAYAEGFHKIHTSLTNLGRHTEALEAARKLLLTAEQKSDRKASDNALNMKKISYAAMATVSYTKLITDENRQKNNSADQKKPKERSERGYR